MLQPGTRIVGKWTSSSLTVEKRLGKGANGEVYLVRGPQGLAAMKVCDQPQDIALEWGVLSGLRPTPSFFPKPILMDDSAEPKLYFYLMEWVMGRPLSELIQDLREPSLYELMSQVLQGLEELHGAGYAFCDVKAQNIIVSMQPTLQARFVDAGGITTFGRSVRQFTPFSDRAYWGGGSRRAEPSYDLAAFALMLICAFVIPPSQLTQWPVQERKRWLSKALRSFPESAYIPLLQAILAGSFLDAGSCLDALRQTRQASRPSKGSKGRAKAHGRDWTEWVMWFSLGTTFVVTSIALGSLLHVFG